MAELPAELIHIILADLTDHQSMISLALTSRLYYTTAMPVILAKESRYVRQVLIPGRHLSIYDFPYPHARLPPAGLDSPAGPFTGTIRMINFKPWRDPMYLCCMHRLVRRAKHLEQITMDVRDRSDRAWIVAFINICVARPGVSFTVNGGDGSLAITDFEERLGVDPMGRLRSPFDYPQHLPPMSPNPGSTTKQNNISRIYQQLKSTATLKRVRAQAGSQTHSNPSGLIAPRITAFKLINENIFGSPIARVVRSLANSEHITSFTFVNAHDYNYHDYHIDSDEATASPMAIFATLSLPSLTRLSIAHIFLSTAALIHFLARHPSITDLYLDLLYPFLYQGYISVKSLLIEWRVSTSPPKRFLPNLARLGGNAHWVLPFVQWRLSKSLGGGNAGHLPALEELKLREGLEGLELREGVASARQINLTRYIASRQLHWETGQFHAVYDALFRVNGPSRRLSGMSWKAFSSNNPTSERRTRIHSLTLEMFSDSRFVDWLILQAVKHQAWPMLYGNAGASIETIIASSMFLIAFKTRTELLTALGQWCPELLKEIEADRRAHGWHPDDGGYAYAGLDAPWPDMDADLDYALENAFTEYLLQRVIWHTFPNLQTLQIGADKRDRPPPQQASMPVRLRVTTHVTSTTPNIVP